MLTVNEVADMLRVHPRTIRRWIHDKKLKAHKIEGVVRIDEQDLRDFINKPRRIKS